MGVERPQVLTTDRGHSKHAIDCDVVVVGGGPAGLIAARELASAGSRVRVLEEHDVIGAPVHCTGVLGLDAFDELQPVAASDCRRRGCRALRLSQRHDGRDRRRARARGRRRSRDLRSRSRRVGRRRRRHRSRPACASPASRAAPNRSPFARRTAARARSTRAPPSWRAAPATASIARSVSACRACSSTALSSKFRFRRSTKCRCTSAARSRPEDSPGSFRSSASGTTLCEGGSALRARCGRRFQRFADVDSRRARAVASPGRRRACACCRSVRCRARGPIASWPWAMPPDSSSRRPAAASTTAC